MYMVVRSAKIVLALAMLTFMAGPSRADVVESGDPTFGPFGFQNHLNAAIYDLVVEFSGTGGTLSNPKLTLNTGPGDVMDTAVTDAGAQVTVTWDPMMGGLAPGGMVRFKVDSMFGAEVSTWSLSDKNGKILVTYTPEPSLIVPLSVVLVGVVGLMYRRRISASGHLPGFRSPLP
jgi:hypothetical protein